MKRIWLAVLALGLLAGCGSRKADFSFADLKGVDFCFTSGVGAWSTQVTIAPDGSFQGSFSDADMGDTGEGYPNGSRYECSFSGTLTPPVPVDAWTVSTSVETLVWDREAVETVEEGVRVIPAGPYGLEGAEELRLYLPEAPRDKLPEPFLQWIDSWALTKEDSRLGRYGLYNVREEYGFLG